jgi:hypothetical protein
MGSLEGKLRLKTEERSPLEDGFYMLVKKPIHPDI